MRSWKSTLVMGALLAAVTLIITLSIGSRLRERSLLDISEPVLDGADRLSFKPYWIDDDNLFVARFAKAVPGKFTNGYQCFQVHVKTGKETWIRSLSKTSDLRMFQVPIRGLSPDRQHVIRYDMDAARNVNLRVYSTATRTPVGAAVSETEYDYSPERSLAWSRDSTRWSILGLINRKWILRTYTMVTGKLIAEVDVSHVLQDPTDNMTLIGFEAAGNPVIVRNKICGWSSWCPADLCVVDTSTNNILRTATLVDKRWPGRTWINACEVAEAGNKIAWLLCREPRDRDLPPLLSRLMPFLNKQYPGAIELWVSNIDGTQRRRVGSVHWTNHDNRPEITGIFWSPTGKYLTFRCGSWFRRVPAQ